MNPYSLRTRYRIVPGPVQVTYKVQNAGSGVPVDGARQLPLTNAERMITPFVENVTDCMWMVPADTLGGIVPKPGDSVQDPTGAVWIFGQQITSALMQNDWKAYAVKTR